MNKIRKFTFLDGASGARKVVIVPPVRMIRHWQDVMAPDLCQLCGSRQLSRESRWLCEKCDADSVSCVCCCSPVIPADTLVVCLRCSQGHFPQQSVMPSVSKSFTDLANHIDNSTGWSFVAVGEATREDFDVAVESGTLPRVQCSVCRSPLIVRGAAMHCGSSSWRLHSGGRSRRPS